MHTPRAPRRMPVAGPRVADWSLIGRLIGRRLVAHLPRTGTLLSVFVLKWQLISFGFVVIQFAALTWYMLSYVPYGQQCLKGAIRRLTK